MNLRYVFSAPAMLRLMPSTWEKENQEEYAKTHASICEGLKKIRKDASAYIPGVSFGIDLLFNAFTEREFGNWLTEKDLFGFERLYADSGGLQIVTAGKRVDDSLKSQIYKTQSKAHYAMCFDEIPVRTVGVADTKSNRSQTSNKLFYPKMKKECAIKTAKNIREQIEAFDSLKAQTKVHYIIQGNTYDDMFEWFSDGISVLDDSHFEYVGGLAIADTCMGNGPLESIDMLVAYHMIRKEFSEKRAKNHLHLLGVGSVQRLLPVIYLLHSGFLDKDLVVSFDSTSFSMSYFLGRFSDENGDQMKKKDHVNMRKYFMKVYEYFEEIYEKNFPGHDKDKFIEHIVKESRSIADTINNADPDISPLVRANITLSCCWQVLGFIEKIKNVRDNIECDQTPIGMLKYVKNLEDYEHWKKDFSRFIKSNRIQREHSFSIDNFFTENGCEK